MGCGTSNQSPSTPKQEDDPQFPEELSYRQVEIIRDSWALIQDDMLETGVVIYQTFFKSLETDLLILFSKVIKNEGGERLVVDDVMLHRHAQMVMEGLGTIVRVVADPEALNTLIEYLANVHRKNNVKPYVLMKLWPAINSCFKAILSDVYTPEVELAWEKLFCFTVSRMQIEMDRLAIKNKTRAANNNDLAEENENHC